MERNQSVGIKLQLDRVSPGVSTAHDWGWIIMMHYMFQHRVKMDFEI